MSLIKHVLNRYLRLTEKRHMMRARTPDVLRRSFAAKARLFFWPPRGTQFQADTIAGIAVERVRAGGVQDDAGPLLLYFHGGGYIFGAPRTHRAMLARLSHYAGLPACLPDYRKAPEHPFPAALDDALAVYQVLATRPGGLVLGGDSAGGGLALAVLAEVLRKGWRKPLGVFAFSPVTDLTFSAPSVAGNAAADVVLPAARAPELAEMYLQGHDARDPRASPLYAGFEGAPPVWITVGDTEILLDDTRRMAAHLSAGGVDVTEIIAHDLPHVWPIFHNTLPEARATLRDLAVWIKALSHRTGEN